MLQSVFAFSSELITPSSPFCKGALAAYFIKKWVWVVSAALVGSLPHLWESHKRGNFTGTEIVLWFLHPRLIPKYPIDGKGDRPNHHDHNPQPRLVNMVRQWIWSTSSAYCPEHWSAEHDVLRGGDLLQPEGVKAEWLWNFLWAAPRGYCRPTGLNRNAEADSQDILGLLIPAAPTCMRSHFNFSWKLNLLNAVSDPKTESLARTCPSQDSS